MGRRAGPRAWTISVPASIANLGPGLDALALAVDLYLRLKVRRAEGANCLRFHFLNLELSGANLIEDAFHLLAVDREFPGLEVEVETEILDFSCPIRSRIDG